MVTVWFRSGEHAKYESADHVVEEDESYYIKRITSSDVNTTTYEVVAIVPKDAVEAVEIWQPDTDDESEGDKVSRRGPGVARMNTPCH